MSGGYYNSYLPVNFGSLAMPSYLLLFALLIVLAGCSSQQAVQTGSDVAGTSQSGEAVSTTGKDFQKLVDILVPFSKKVLERSGKFDPFAAAIDTSGEPSLFSADIEEGERTDSAQLLALLVRGLDRGRADGQLRATGVCFPVKTTLAGSNRKTDAIRLALRRIDGADRDVLIPYRKSKKGRIKYETALFFVPADSTNLTSLGRKTSGLD